MGPESDIQFLARMIVLSREGGQIPGHDARRLNNLATYGDSMPRGSSESERSQTTLPEERRPLPSTAVPGEVAPGAEYPVVSG
jgi:hypothetical protein